MNDIKPRFFAGAQNDNSIISVFQKTTTYAKLSWPRRGRLGCSGVTLIEMIVAIVVIGIAMTAIMNAFSSLEGSLTPEYTIQAAALGQLQMEAISAKTRLQVPVAGTYSCAAFQAGPPAVPEVQCPVLGFPEYTYSWLVEDVSAATPDVASAPVFAAKVTLTVSRPNMPPINYYTLFGLD